MPEVRNPGAEAECRDPDAQDLINRLVLHIDLMYIEANEITDELGNFHSGASNIAKQQAAHKKKRVTAWKNCSKRFNEQTALLQSKEEDSRRWKADYEDSQLLISPYRRHEDSEAALDVDENSRFSRELRRHHEEETSLTTHCTNNLQLLIRSTTKLGRKRSRQ